MNVTHLAFAAALALSPAVAGAVTYNGGFNPGGVLDTEHDIDASGFQNDAIIRASSADAGAAYTQSWTFTATEKLIVSGVGTIRQPGFFSGLAVLFDGLAVALLPGAGGTDTFAFPTVGLAPGEDVVVTVSWDDYIGTGGDSSTITFDLTTDPVAAPIPLPAAGWMLLGALGGLGALTRSRRAKI
jgi:hypothetical protein